MADPERHRVTLTDVAFGGDCIARIDNQIVFASYGIPGEEVVVELSQSKRDYLRGRVAEVIAPSPARIQPKCPLFGQCGGCRWQHIDYPTQTEMKRRIVADQLRRIGGFGDDVIVNPTLQAEDPWNYRNHARFSVRRGQLGFTIEGSRRFLEVDECHIMHPAINEVLASLKGKLRQRLHQVAVRYGVNTGHLLVNPTIKLEGLALATGQEYLEEELLGRRFRVAAASFFQVNTPQAERMVRYVLDQLKLGQQDVLVDVYCGVGTFGLLAAEKVARVIGVEDSAAALRDASFNAQDLENVTFIKGAAEDVLGTLRERIDAAIIDPPRTGCKPEVIEALRRMQPGKILYVSCDPATLARDLKGLCDDGRYRITDIQPIDMFPQTYHIETVVTLRSV